MRLLTVLLLLLIGSATAQEAKLHVVKDGRAGVSIYYRDTLLSIGSNKVRILLDDQTKEITIRMNPSSFRTGIDSLDVKLKNGIHQDVVFRGTIGLDRLFKRDKSDQNFEVEGELELNGVVREISMNGSLRESQQGMGITSMLYLHFDPELSQFGLDEALPHFAEFGCVEILQPLSLPENRH